MSAISKPSCAALFAVLKAALDLGENPRPRGYDKVEGGEGIYRVWVGRDWRVLYSIHADRNEPTVEALRKKDEGTVPGQYMPVWPVYIVGDNPEELYFSVAVDEKHVPVV